MTIKAAPENKVPFNVIRSGHVEFEVTDLGRARAFYVDVLGFVVTEETPDALYLRGYEERVHHSLVLRKAARAAVSHIAFRVASAGDLEALERLCTTHDLPVRRVAPGEEAGQGRAIRTQDPVGIAVEFYCDMEPVPSLLQRFDLYRGAQVQRIDHFNCLVPDVSKAYSWWREQLGFWVSEYTETDGPNPTLWAVWLHRKPNVHDIALMNGHGPRLHHVGFWVPDPMGVIRACDVVAAAGWADSIERGPGRHGLSNAFFVYLRDPDGHRVELYTGDYLTADPDAEAIRWSISDRRRQTFWGHAAPRSWFEEASPFLRVDGGALEPVREPVLIEKVPYVY